MEIEISSQFERSFRRLHPRIQKKAVLRMRIFKESNGRDPRLEVHKLHGKQKEEWAYSVDYSFRISFIFLTPLLVLYTNIGTHDEVY